MTRRRLFICLLLTALATGQTNRQSDWVRKLKEVAKQKGYYYSVFCTEEDNPAKHFQAMLCESNCIDPYVVQRWYETGWWQAEQGATADEAIAKLLVRVRNNDWYAPKPEKPKEPKQCPPPIKGKG